MNPLYRLYEKSRPIIPETRAATAERAGTTIEFAIRAIRELQANSILQRERRRIEIIFLENTGEISSLPVRQLRHPSGDSRE